MMDKLSGSLRLIIRGAGWKEATVGLFAPTIMAFAMGATEFVTDYDYMARRKVAVSDA